MPMMRDLQADWRRWSRAERLAAAIVAALYGIPIMNALPAPSSAWASTAARRDPSADHGPHLLRDNPHDIILACLRLAPILQRSLTRLTSRVTRARPSGIARR